MLFLCLEIKRGVGKEMKYFQGPNSKGDQTQNIMQTAFQLPIPLSGGEVWRSGRRESVLEPFFQFVVSNRAHFKLS